jgi:hypothetical protein
MNCLDQYDFDYEDMEKKELIDMIKKLQSENGDLSDEIIICKEIVTTLTDKDITHFVKISSDGEIDFKEDNINNFISSRKQNNSNDKDFIELKQLLPQLKEQLSKANNKILILQKEIFDVQTPLRNKITDLENKNKELNTEIKTLISKDVYQKKKEYISYLENNRKNLQLIPKHKQDIIQNENALLEEYFSALETKLEILFDTNELMDNNFIQKEISSILTYMQDIRYKISLVLSEQEFIDYIEQQTKKLNELLSVYASRCKVKKLTCELSSYEKCLINYKLDQESYLNISLPISILQKRFLETVKYEEIRIFKGKMEPIPYYLHFCNITDIIRRMLITCKPFNNIVLIPVKEGVGPDFFNYYTLDFMEETNTKSKKIKKSGKDEKNDTQENNTEIDTEDIVIKRHWKLDPYLIGTVRLFINLFNSTAINIFKKFYKDVFGHNNYISKFEQSIQNKQIKHWQNMKILWENIQIINDENLIGEIIRKIIRTECTFFPETNDIIKETKNRGSTQDEFKRLRIRYNNKLPAFEEEPEIYIYNCFDKATSWNMEETSVIWKNRWKNYLEGFLSDN